MSGSVGVRLGVIGADAPRQILLAAGATPVRLFGAWEGDAGPDARDLLGAADAVATRILDRLLVGDFKDVAGLIVCNDSAANLRLFYVLRVLALRGSLSIPVHLLDLPRGAGSPRELFAVRQFARLAEFCTGLTGTAVDAATLATAAVREERLGQALLRLRDRRRSGLCAGTAALDALAAAATLPPEEAITAVDETGGASVEGARIVVTGGSHPDSSVYRAVEQEGVVIVAEDHDAGDAAWLGVAVRDPLAEGVLAGLARAHAARPPLAARSRSAERAAALADLIRLSGARGVLALARELDDAPAWDERDQRAVCDSLAIPMEGALRIRPGEAVAAAGSAARRLRRRMVEVAG